MSSEWIEVFCFDDSVIAEAETKETETNMIQVYRLNNNMQSIISNILKKMCREYVLHFVTI